MKIKELEEKLKNYAALYMALRKDLNSEEKEAVLNEMCHFQIVYLGEGEDDDGENTGPEYIVEASYSFDNSDSAIVDVIGCESVGSPNECIQLIEEELSALFTRIADKAKVDLQLEADRLFKEYNKLNEQLVNYEENLSACKEKYFSLHGVHGVK